MKKKVLIIGLLLTSFGSYSFHTTINTRPQISVKEAISVSVSVSSTSGAVSGALVKISLNGVTIGAGTTDATGKATIAIASYNKQPVSIDVTHVLYKEQKMTAVILENGKALSFVMKSKSENAAEVTKKSEEKVTKIEEKTSNTVEKTEE